MQERVTLVRLETERNPWLSGDFASKPFLARDAQDGRWVVKPLWQRREAKSLFNEWVCGRLCNLMGVPWPEVALTTVPLTLEHPLTPGRPVADAHAVALRWIPDLLDVDAYVERHIDPERPAVYELQESWLERGIARLVASRPDNFDAMGGLAVAGNWLQAADQQWSVLQVDATGKLWWMDSSCHLGGWGWHLFHSDDPFEMFNDRHFRTGEEFWGTCDPRGRTSMVHNLVHLDLLEPWLQRIEALDAGLWQTLMAAMPAHWVEPAYMGTITRHVWEGRLDFTQRYRKLLT